MGASVQFVLAISDNVLSLKEIYQMLYLNEPYLRGINKLSPVMPPTLSQHHSPPLAFSIENILTPPTPSQHNSHPLAFSIENILTPPATPSAESEPETHWMELETFIKTEPDIQTFVSDQPSIQHLLTSHKPGFLHNPKPSYIRSKHLTSGDFLPPPSAVIHHYPKPIDFSILPFVNLTYPNLSSQPTVTLMDPQPTLLKPALTSNALKKRLPKAHSAPPLSHLPSSKTQLKVRTRRHGTSTQFRTYFQSHHKTLLENEFDKSPFLTSNKLALLVSILGRSEKSIKTWFQNKRAFQKRRLAAEERMRIAAESFLL